MKKHLILFALLLIAAPQFAQVTFAPILGTTFSTKSGWYNDNYGGPKQNNKFITRFTGGLALNVEISEMISLQTEFLYTQKGMSTAKMYPFFDGSGTNYSIGTYKVFYNIVEVPLLIKFTFGDKFKYFVEGGPYVNYAINGKYIYDPYPQTNPDEKTKGKIKFEEFSEENWTKESKPHPEEYYNRWDVGFYVGAGVGAEFGPGTLVFDMRFGMGFIDYYKTENFTYVPDGYRSFYNRNINLTLAYYIPII
jgi:hypothetical protein